MRENFEYCGTNNGRMISKVVLKYRGVSDYGGDGRILGYVRSELDISSDIDVKNKFMKESYPTSLQRRLLTA